MVKSNDLIITNNLLELFTYNEVKPLLTISERNILTAISYVQGLEFSVIQNIALYLEGAISFKDVIKRHLPFLEEHLNKAIKIEVDIYRLKPDDNFTLLFCTPAKEIIVDVTFESVSQECLSYKPAGSRDEIWLKQLDPLTSHLILIYD